MRDVDFTEEATERYDRAKEEVTSKRKKVKILAK